MAFKIGLVGLCTSHPGAWVPVIRELAAAGAAEVEVVAAWDSGETRPAGFASQFCAENNIPRPLENLDKMVGLVDGVIVHTANWDRHLEEAEPFVRAGKAVYLDKPIAGNFRDLARIADWVKEGRRVTGGSVLHYCREALALRDEVATAGETVHSAYSAIGVDDFNYGIHGYAILHALLGEGIQSVRYLGSSNQKQLMLNWSGGRVALLTAGKTKWLPFNLTAVTGSGVHQVSVDNGELYRSMLRRVLPWFCGQAAEPPLSPTSLLEPELAALAAKLSWQRNGAEVFLSDLGFKDEAAYDGAAFACEYRRARLG